MSQTPQEMIGLFERTTNIVNRQAEGLSHVDSLLQLPVRGNCFNWVLGHIVESRDKILAMYDHEVVLSADEVALYCRGSDPITDGETAVSFERLLSDFNRQYEIIVASFSATDVEKFNEIINEKHGFSFGDRISFLHWHETYHTGQFEILRQLAGVDDAIIK